MAFIPTFSKTYPRKDLATRSHESGYYRRKFWLRLDDETSRKLEALTQTFDCSAAEVIRQLIIQASPGDFPKSWRLEVQEPRESR